MSVRIDAKIIVESLPLFEWVNSQRPQKLVELFGKYLAALGRKILAGNASATVSARHSNCLAIQLDRFFSVEQDFLLTDSEFLFHVANSIAAPGLLRTLPEVPLEDRWVPVRICPTTRFIETRAFVCLSNALRMRPLGNAI